MQALEIKWFEMHRVVIGVVILTLVVVLAGVAIISTQWMSDDDSIAVTNSAPPIPESHIMRVYEWNTTLPPVSLSPLPMPREPRLPGAATRF
jgi:hypothetical protein